MLSLLFYFCIKPKASQYLLTHENKKTIISTNCDVGNIKRLLRAIR